MLTKMARNVKLPVTLITGRTIDQGVGKEQGKASQVYMDSVAVCFLDPKDLSTLGIEENSNIVLSTEYGTVVLKALKSIRGRHLGIAYVPYGPWANSVISMKTDSVGMPSSKGVPATIEPASGKTVLSVTHLLEDQFKKD